MNRLPHLRRSRAVPALLILLACSFVLPGRAATVSQTGFEPDPEEFPGYPMAPGTIVKQGFGHLPLRPRSDAGTYTLVAEESSPFGAGQCLYVVGNGSGGNNISLEAPHLPVVATVSFDFCEPSVALGGGSPWQKSEIWVGFAAGDRGSKAYLGWTYRNGVFQAGGVDNTVEVARVPRPLPVLSKDKVYTVWMLLNRSHSPRSVDIPGNGSIVLQPTQGTLFVVDKESGQTFFYGVYQHKHFTNQYRDPIPDPTALLFRSWGGGNTFYLDNFVMYDKAQSQFGDMVDMRTWTGQGGDGNWSTAGNWQDSIAPASGDALTFTGFENTGMINDYADATEFESLLFDSDSDDFTLDGNSITLLTSVEMQAFSMTAEISVPLVISDQVKIEVANYGYVFLGGVISGQGALQKTGEGTITLDKANSYTGGTIVDMGQVEVYGDQTASTGGWDIGRTSSEIPAEVMFAEGAIVEIPAGRNFNVGRPEGGGLNRLVTVLGEVTNHGKLTLGTGASLDVFDNGLWNQRGEMSLQGMWGYAPELHVQPGATFVYEGPSPILLRPGSSANRPTTFAVAGGTLITSRGFRLQPNAQSPRPARLLISHGTVQLTEDVSQLAEGIEVSVDGDATIDTNGYNTAIDTLLTGGGSLVKTGEGRLTVQISPGHTGDTLVREGTLSLQEPGLDDGAMVLVMTGAVLDLDFSGTDVVQMLSLDGEALPPGLYGAADLPGLITGPGLLEVTGEVVPSGFSDWAADQGLSGDPEADSDADGLGDVMEYALAGLDPLRSDAFPGRLSGNTLRFDKRPAAVQSGDVRYRIEVSNNLGHWQPVAEEHLVESDEHISVTISETGTEEQLFLRLRVELVLPSGM